MPRSFYTPLSSPFSSINWQGNSIITSVPHPVLLSIRILPPSYYYLEAASDDFLDYIRRCICYPFYFPIYLTRGNWCRFYVLSILYHRNEVLCHHLRQKLYCFCQYPISFSASCWYDLHGWTTLFRQNEE